MVYISVDLMMHDAGERMTDVVRIIGVERMTGIDVDLRLPDVDLFLRMTDFDLTVTDVDEH